MEETEEKEQGLSKAKRIVLIIIAWPALLTWLWISSYFDELTDGHLSTDIFIIVTIVLFSFILFGIEKIKRLKKFQSVNEKFHKKLSRAGKDRLVLILTIIIALVFWVVFIYSLLLNHRWL